MIDPVEFGKAMACIVKDATAPLLSRLEAQDARIKELEARQPIAGPAGEKGEPGPIGEPGPGPSDAQIAEAVAKHLAENPPPRGEKGEPGPQGPSGADAVVDVHEVVRALVACDEIAPIIDMHVAAEVAKYMDEHPVRDGRDGKDGERGPQGEAGKSVTMDDVSPLLEAAIAKHVLELERRAFDTVARALDKIVQPKDGKDGICNVIPTFEQIDDRTIAIRSVLDGVVLNEANFTFPVPIYRDRYESGRKYVKGDIVYRDGSSWIARKDTDAVPCFENREYWSVYARKGKDARPSAALPEGKKAPPARIKKAPDAE